MRHSQTALATEGQLEQLELIFRSALRNARLDKYAVQRAIQASTELKQKLIDDLQAAGKAPRNLRNKPKQPGISEETRKIRDVLMADEMAMIPISE